jgi:hypothetical protein
MSCAGAACESCVFYRGVEEQAGECRRYPPTAWLSPSGLTVMGPPVRADGWCGEWREVT